MEPYQSSENSDKYLLRYYSYQDSELKKVNLSKARNFYILVTTVTFLFALSLSHVWIGKEAIYLNFLNVLTPEQASQQAEAIRNAREAKLFRIRQIAHFYLPATDYQDPCDAARLDCCTDPSFPVLGGVDIVNFHLTGEIVFGDPRFSAVISGVTRSYTFWFSDESLIPVFQASPASYLPKWGGFNAGEFCTGGGLISLIASTVDLNGGVEIDGHIAFTEVSGETIKKCDEKFQSLYNDPMMGIFNTRCVSMSQFKTPVPGLLPSMPPISIPLKMSQVINEILPATVLTYSAERSQFFPDAAQTSSPLEQGTQPLYTSTFTNTLDIQDKTAETGKQPIPAVGIQDKMFTVALSEQAQTTNESSELLQGTSERSVFDGLEKAAETLSHPSSSSPILVGSTHLIDSSLPLAQLPEVFSYEPLSNEQQNAPPVHTSKKFVPSLPVLPPQPNIVSTSQVIAPPTVVPSPSVLSPPSDVVSTSQVITPPTVLSTQWKPSWASSVDQALAQSQAQVPPHDLSTQWTPTRVSSVGQVQSSVDDALAQSQAQVPPNDLSTLWTPSWVSSVDQALAQSKAQVPPQDLPTKWASSVDQALAQSQVQKSSHVFAPLPAPPPFNQARTQSQVQMPSIVFPRASSLDQALSHWKSSSGQGAGYRTSSSDQAAEVSVFQRSSGSNTPFDFPSIPANMISKPFSPPVSEVGKAASSQTGFGLIPTELKREMRKAAIEKAVTNA